MTKKSKKITKNRPATMFCKPKEIKVVTRKVLNDIARNIYNPKTGRYLNLCSGTLLNGPDPACSTRSMHCGLGELYYVIAGEQPDLDEVDESDVADFVTERSTIYDLKPKDRSADIKAKIKQLGLDQELTKDATDYLLNMVESSELDLYKDRVEAFRSLLRDRVPYQNDIDKKGPRAARAKRVAGVIREAAKLLPR